MILAKSSGVIPNGYERWTNGMPAPGEDALYWSTTGSWTRWPAPGLKPAAGNYHKTGAPVIVIVPKN